MIHNKLFLIVPTALLLATVLTLVATFTIPTFAQSEGTNQTMQNAGESANQTGGELQKNASDVGSKITEGAKDLAGNIGEKLQDVGK